MYLNLSLFSLYFLFLSFFLSLILAHSFSLPFFLSVKGQSIAGTKSKVKT